MVVVDRVSLENVLDCDLPVEVKDAFNLDEVKEFYKAVVGKELTDPNQLLELSKEEAEKLQYDTNHVAFSLIRLKNRY